MTKRIKRLTQMRTNPKTIRFDHLHHVLTDLGFAVRQPKSGSSHYIYFKDDIQFTIPYKRPYIKEIYVKRILELIDKEDI